MKVYSELARRAAAGEACALATVVATEGSAPAQAAMKMLVGREGRICGTVGGGRVEAAVERAARDALENAAPRVLSFTLDDDLADEGGLICGGNVKILVERVAPPAAWAAEAARAVEDGRRGALLARIGDSVERRLVSGEESQAWIEDERPRLSGDVFVEPLVRPRCILVGAGHVGRALAAIAGEAGFFVAVVEDRPGQAARVSADRVVEAPLEEGLRSLAPSRDDFVVLMTRGHGLDLRCARVALSTPARYVGMLASRKKAAAIREALSAEGVDVARLAAPIGLDLGAVSAGEIALSAVAQMVRLRRTGRSSR